MLAGYNACCQSTRWTRLSCAIEWLKRVLYPQRLKLNMPFYNRWKTCQNVRYKFAENFFSICYQGLRRYVGRPAKPTYGRGFFPGTARFLPTIMLAEVI